jgi:ammonia channel protein AmtB
LDLHFQYVGLGNSISINPYSELGQAAFARLECADVGGIIGGFDFLGLNNVGQSPSPVYATTRSPASFHDLSSYVRYYHRSLWTGSVVERMKFSSLVLVSVLWSTLVYLPVAHWVWGSGGCWEAPGTRSPADGVGFGTRGHPGCRYLCHIPDGP